jgi:hypothetical protein
MSKRLFFVSFLTIAMLLFAACGGKAPAEEAVSTEAANAADTADSL